MAWKVRVSAHLRAFKEPTTADIYLKIIPK